MLDVSSSFKVFFKEIGYKWFYLDYRNFNYWVKDCFMFCLLLGFCLKCGYKIEIDLKYEIEMDI